MHLQCHIGTDTLSLARLGATMTGLDFSGPALEVARRLAARHGQMIEYVESELYDAPIVLARESFDFMSEETTYVEHEGELASPMIVSFNHGLSEIFNALWSAGMHITIFEEHRSVPWNPLDDAMEEYTPGEFRLRSQPERLPLSYTLRAEKR